MEPAKCICVNRSRHALFKKKQTPVHVHSRPHRAAYSVYHLGLFVSFQGAKCFDYNASLQLMVTGGCDRAVRLWTRFVTTRPVTTLLGHRTTVLDVAIYQPAGQIFSYSRDAVSH